MRSLGTRVLLAGGESGPGGWFFPRARIRPKALGYPPGAERDGETRLPANQDLPVDRSTLRDHAGRFAQ